MPPKSVEKISGLLDIPVDSLKKFSRTNQTTPPAMSPKELPPMVVELVNFYLRSRKGGKKRSVKEFCGRNPELLKQLNMTPRQVSEWLFKLGFANRGKFIKNTGLDRIIRFKPNAIWGTDGKQMDITINGITYRWIWQCLIDYKTTVIVGGILGETETTDNLFQALQGTKEKKGDSPLAIVLDNRLSENLPAIREYLDHFNIKMIKTFPGNAKSNGIIENNFNIFERWVSGKIVINAENEKELSQTIASTLVEVFTQMRNHSPRKKFSMKSPSEIMEESEKKHFSSEENLSMKKKIAELSDRFKPTLEADFGGRLNL